MSPDPFPRERVGSGDETRVKHSIMPPSPKFYEVRIHPQHFSRKSLKSVDTIKSIYERSTIYSSMIGRPLIDENGGI